nr:HNH endonuclease [Xenorhabdus budapestensis]
MFKNDEDWDIHHIIRRTDGSGDKIDNLIMLHPNCHRQLHVVM